MTALVLILAIIVGAFVVALAFTGMPGVNGEPPWPVELTLARAAECLRRIGYGSADV